MKSHHVTCKVWTGAAPQCKMLFCVSRQRLPVIFRQKSKEFCWLRATFLIAPTHFFSLPGLWASEPCRFVRLYKAPARDGAMQWSRRTEVTGQRQGRGKEVWDGCMVNDSCFTNADAQISNLHSDTVSEYGRSIKRKSKKYDRARSGARNCIAESWSYRLTWSIDRRLIAQSRCVSAILCAVHFIACATNLG